MHIQEYLLPDGWRPGSQLERIPVLAPFPDRLCSICVSEGRRRKPIFPIREWDAISQYL
jgi:hypothetical protein